MNKSEFINHIAEKHNCPKTEATKVIDMFTSSVVSAIEEKKEISLIGFGSFTVGKREASTGRNPKTGEPLNIPAFNQVRFRAGQLLKEACKK
jgi:DNA-binding protein HU-beta